jgi:hypothetical protein
MVVGGGLVVEYNVEIYKPRLWEVAFISYNIYKDRRTDAEAVREHGKRRHA